MEKLDIRPIIKAIIETVNSHELEIKGQYCRWLWQKEGGKPRRLGVNEYGCADAANILYTLNEFYSDPETRAARVKELQALQDPETGMFTEETHHTIHTTAHCTAAIQLFDEKPLYPIKGLHKYYDEKELYALLDGLDWVYNPWSQSHLGAGVYAALVNAGEMTEELQESYFKWFWDNADEETGFWKKGYVQAAPWGRTGGFKTQAPIYFYMAGAFHYLFNHEYARMPLRYPERVIDSCIRMYREVGVSESFCRSIGFLEIDWLYCINRASRQTPHRNAEVRELISDFAVRLVSYLSEIDYSSHDGFNDLHALFGTVCALAELQSALPGRIITGKPLRLVLDRRPFI